MQINNAVEAFQLQSLKRKRSKYRNVKTVVDNITFDSKKEARVYSELKLLLQSNKIDFFSCQYPIDIHINGIAVCKYIADFHVVKHGFSEFWDVKGIKTPIYRLKKKMVKAAYGIDIKEV